MAYTSTIEDLRRYLSGLTTSPDSVIASMFEEQHFMLGAMREFQDLGADANGVQVVLKESTGIANSKWLRDEWFISVQAVGQDRGKYKQCEDLIHGVFNSLLGSDTLYLGDRAYVQMNSDDMPRFVGYLENSMPIFTASLNFVVEGLTDIHNREALK